MSITLERKQELVQEYQRKKDDTGSPEVQVAILSERIFLALSSRAYLSGTPILLSALTFSSV